MTQPALALLVKFKSSLPFEEAAQIAQNRIGEFRALPGLLQKYYLREPATGAVCGLYLWESREAFNEFRDSELRKSIAQAYQAEGEPRIEVFEVFEILREET